MQADNVIPLQVGAQPQPLRCTCGKDWPWSWYVPHVNGRVYAGRWAAPKLNPCQLCELPPEVLHERALRARLIHAGVPDPLLVYSLERSSLVQQGVGESDEDFRRRVAELRRTKAVLGVSLGQLTAYRALLAWKPPTWLLLHGPPGTGKTTVMAALARRMLATPPDRWELRGGRRTLLRWKVQRVEYHRLDEVVSREIVKMRGLDDAPTRDVARVGVLASAEAERRPKEYDRGAVLMLDELGLSPKPSEAETRLVERVLGYRAEHGLCTVLASNRDLDELVGPGCIYGWRVGDRLQGALAVALTGDSWRAP